MTNQLGFLAAALLAMSLPSPDRLLDLVTVVSHELSSSSSDEEDEKKKPHPSFPRPLDLLEWMITHKAYQNRPFNRDEWVTHYMNEATNQPFDLSMRGAQTLVGLRLFHSNVPSCDGCALIRGEGGTRMISHTTAMNDVVPPLPPRRMLKRRRHPLLEDDDTQFPSTEHAVSAWVDALIRITQQPLFSPDDKYTTNQLMVNLRTPHLRYVQRLWYSKLRMIQKAMCTKGWELQRHAQDTNVRSYQYQLTPVVDEVQRPIVECLQPVAVLPPQKEKIEPLPALKERAQMLYANPEHQNILRPLAHWQAQMDGPTPLEWQRFFNSDLNSPFPSGAVPVALTWNSPPLFGVCQPEQMPSLLRALTTPSSSTLLDLLRIQAQTHLQCLHVIARKMSVSF